MADQRVRWLAALAVLLIAVAALVAPGAAKADTATMYAMVDQTRASAGLPPLRRSAGLQGVAQAWANQAAATRTLAHNPSYTTQIPAGWQRAGENIGWAGSDRELLDAFLASPGHRDNILGAYTDVGIGRAVDAAGNVWEVQEFGTYASAPDAAPLVVLPDGDPAQPAQPSDGVLLKRGGSLPVGRQLVSPSGRVSLVLQGDGNLVVYAGGRPSWSSGTWGTSAPITRLTLQADGNLVGFSGDAQVWWAGTQGSGAQNLYVQDDGNVVLYRGDGVPVWSTLVALQSNAAPGLLLSGPGVLVSPGRGFASQISSEGALTVYGPAGPLWTSGLGPSHGAVLAVQGDGNLVIYGGGAALWATGTYGQGLVTLMQQDDGNLVLYRVADGAAVWSVYTGRLV